MISPDFIFTFTLILHSIATWSDWGQWQSCSSSCGGGTRHRVTVCGDLNSEGDSSKGDSCDGEAPRQTEKCNNMACRKFHPFWINLKIMYKFETFNQSYSKLSWLYF